MHSARATGHNGITCRLTPLGSSRECRKRSDEFARREVVPIREARRIRHPNPHDTGVLCCFRRERLATVDTAASQYGRTQMFRFVIGLLGMAAFALPAAAQVQPFPAGFQTQEIATNGATIHVRVGGAGPGGRAAARLRRDRRHVGAAGGRSRSRPHGHRARPARAGALVQARRRLRQEDPGRRRRGRARRAEDRPRRSRHARHRQHGRLRLRRAASRAGRRASC